MFQDDYINLGDKKKEFDSKILNIESMLMKIGIVFLNQKKKQRIGLNFQDRISSLISSQL